MSLDEYEPALRLVTDSALGYLATLSRDPARLAEAEAAASTFTAQLPEEGKGTIATLRELAQIGSIATVRSAGPRFFHWVTGGATPAALGADWLTSTFDQNARFWANSPLAVQLEQVSLDWLKQLLNLPAEWAGVLTTGATMANFGGLAAARQWWGNRHGVDVDEVGLGGLPSIPVFASGWVHPTTLKALAMLGIGRNNLRVLGRGPSGALDVDKLALALKEQREKPAIVIATAGEVNTGQFDPIVEIATLCRDHDAWMHVDGAFGLFARVTPQAAALAAGIEFANSVASDAHKWLNVPYDCGFLFLREVDYLESAMRSQTAFVGERRLNFSSRSPENSRRARSLPIWATLRAYGRMGYRTMIERHLKMAQHLAARVDAANDMERLAPAPLNAVFFRYRPWGVGEAELDKLNRHIGEAAQEDGRVYIGSTTRFGGRTGFRPVIVNWRTSEDDVDLIVDTVRELGERLQRRSSAALG